MTISDAIKEQTKKTKNMTRRQKLSYFWSYYKVPFLAIVLGIAVLTYCIHTAMTTKKDVLCAVLVNSDATAIPTDMIPDWEKDLSSILKIDTDKYQVTIDNSSTLSLSDTDQYALSNTEKFTAMCSANQIDDVIADTAIFEYYSQFQYFYNLNDVLTSDELKKYSDQLYYTDRSTISSTDDDDFELSDITDRKIDHHDPSSMKDPVPTGIFVTDSEKVKNSGCYDYLVKNKDEFQGHQSEAVIGIPSTTVRLDNARTFLNYILRK